MGVVVYTMYLQPLNLFKSVEAKFVDNIVSESIEGEQTFYAVTTVIFEIWVFRIVASLVHAIKSAF